MRSQSQIPFWTPKGPTLTTSRNFARASILAEDEREVGLRSLCWSLFSLKRVPEVPT